MCNSLHAECITGMECLSLELYWRVLSKDIPLVGLRSGDCEVHFISCLSFVNVFIEPSPQYGSVVSDQKVRGSDWWVPEQGP